MDKPKPKILMISAQLVPEVFGGAEQQCLKLSKQLISDGYQITILTSRSTFKLPYKENLDGIEVVRIWTGTAPQIMGPYILSSLLWLIGCILWFRKNYNGIDIVHIHQAKFQAFVGCLLGRWFRKPVIVKVGNADSSFDLESLKRKAIIGNFLYQTVKNNTTKFIAISTQIQQNFADHNIESYKVINIPNGVSQILTFDEVQQKKQHSRFRLIDKFLNTSTDCKYFLSAGRLSEEKNITLLVKVFVELAKDNKDIWLIILGDGPLQKDIQLLIQENKIEDKVILTGYVKNVNEYMIASDFFVLPSEIEGMSNSLLEAMSIGLIPIASKISGSADLIQHGENGYLVAPPLETNFKDALLTVIKMDSGCILEMQRKSYSTIKAYYTMDLIANRYKTLYSDLVARVNFIPN